MFKYTKHTLKKLEALFQALHYTVRYEKGQFQSGYCIVEHRNVVVINRFFDTEGRINCLLDILATIAIATEKFDDKQAAFYKKITRAQQQAAPSEEASQP